MPSFGTKGELKSDPRAERHTFCGFSLPMPAHLEGHDGAISSDPMLMIVPFMPPP